jgi:hypothetical protein
MVRPLAVPWVWYLTAFDCDGAWPQMESWDHGDTPAYRLLS